jgi:hypothetical protein
VTGLTAETQEQVNRWWVLTPHEIWYLSLFVLIFLILIFLLSNRAQLLKLFKLENEEVITLRSELASMKRYVAELEAKLKNMQVLINVLIERSVVQPEVQATAAPVESSPLRKLSRPVLLVYGVDEFGQQDRDAMRRAGVSFFRLRSASLEDLKTELHRRRSDGNLYDIVHIASHGESTGLFLDSDLVSGVELSEILSGVRAVFLGTCSNQKIADKLVGVVKYVIVIYEEIDTNLAAQFVYEFYKRYKGLLDIEAAYAGAILVIPEVAEFVDLRVRSE